MVRKAQKQLVTEVSQVLRNIERYQSDVRVPGMSERLRKHRAWYAVRHDDDWLFGPSKFIGYANIDSANYLASYNRKDGGETEGVLTTWFKRLDLESKLGRDLEAGLLRFLSLYGKVPRRDFRVSVLKDDLGSEMGTGDVDSTRSDDLLARIDIDPEICSGRPRIRGTRVRVSDILGMLAEGVSWDEIVTDFPYLAREDIAAAVAYAARAVDHRILKAA